VAELREHVRRTVSAALEAIPAGDRSDIYVVSLLVYDEEDDPRLPTVTVGFNTETVVAMSSDPNEAFSTDEREARWNYAFWRQHLLAVVCDAGADRVGAELREQWARSERLWYDLDEGERAAFNQRGEPLTRAFLALLEDVVRGLHEDGVIERVFGRQLPVLIHELEYYDEIADQNLRANPPGVVPEDFVRWCRGEE
jgi:hypothetical protein